MKRRTLKRLPTLDGARFQGPGFGVPGVWRPLSSEALGLLLVGALSNSAETGKRLKVIAHSCLQYAHLKLYYNISS